MLVAMFSDPPQSRPTAEDLLDWPLTAPFADASQVRPPGERPCVVSAHCPGISVSNSPSRNLVAVPGMHQIFSTHGMNEAVSKGSYRWCGEDHELWYVLQDEFPSAEDFCGPVEKLVEAAAGTDDEERPNTALWAKQLIATGEEGINEIVSAAADQRMKGHLNRAENLYRIVLAEELDDGESWLGLAATQFERGNVMAARMSFDHAQAYLGKWEDWAQPGIGKQLRLFGLCEFFVAMYRLRNAVDGKGSETFSESSAGVESSVLPKTPDSDAPAPVRAANVSTYYRSAIALEAGSVESWDVLAALGEFYRVIGSPELPPRRSAPDLATAKTYFELARSMAPASFSFVEDRLARLANV